MRFQELKPNDRFHFTNQDRGICLKLDVEGQYATGKYGTSSRTADPAAGVVLYEEPEASLKSEDHRILEDKLSSMNDLVKEIEDLQTVQEHVHTDDNFGFCVEGSKLMFSVQGATVWVEVSSPSELRLLESARKKVAYIVDLRLKEKKEAYANVSCRNSPEPLKPHEVDSYPYCCLSSPSHTVAVHHLHTVREDEETDLYQFKTDEELRHFLSQHGGQRCDREGHTLPYEFKAFLPRERMGQNVEDTGLEDLHPYTYNLCQSRNGYEWSFAREAARDIFVSRFGASVVELSDEQRLADNRAKAARKYPYCVLLTKLPAVALSPHLPSAYGDIMRFPTENIYNQWCFTEQDFADLFCATYPAAIPCTFAGVML